MNPLIAAGSPDEIEKVQLQYQLNGMRTMTTDYGIGNYNPATGEKFAAAGFKGEISPLYQLNKIALIDRIETDKCSIKFEYSLRGCHPFPENDTRLAFYAGCG